MFEKSDGKNSSTKNKFSGKKDKIESEMDLAQDAFDRMMRDFYGNTLFPGFSQADHKKLFDCFQKLFEVVTVTSVIPSSVEEQAMAHISEIRREDRRRDIVHEILGEGDHLRAESVITDKHTGDIKEIESYILLILKPQEKSRGSKNQGLFKNGTPLPSTPLPPEESIHARQ